MSRTEIVRRLLRLMRPFRGVMAVSIVSRAINQLAGIALITAAGWGIVSAVTRGTGGLLLPLGGALIGIALVKGAFRYLEQFTGHYVAFRLLAELRTTFYRHIAPLAPGGFSDLRSGDIAARFGSDVDRIEPFYAHTIAPVATAILVPGIALLFLGYLHLYFALSILPFLLVLGIGLPWWVNRTNRGLSKQVRSKSGDLNAHVTDSFQGLRDVLVFNYGQRRRREIRQQGEELKEIQQNQYAIRSLQHGVSRGIRFIVIVMILGVGTALVQTGSIQLAEFVNATIVGAMISGPLTKITDALLDYQEAVAAAERLFTLMDRTRPVEDPAEPVAVSDGTPGIRFDQVTFTYPEANGSQDGKPVLRDLSFEVAPGESVGVVGSSGIGKSTILHILLRFHDPDEGQIYLGDRDIRRLGIRDLRDQIAVVPQRIHVFNDSLRENLRLADPEVGEKKMRDVIRKANLDDFVEALPNGLDTELGENGRDLSGGERQRLAIARALLKDAPVLVLDEPTSDLDPVNERLVLDAIRGLKRDQTIIVISHRLTTVRWTDRILVLKDGRIVETGDHDGLLARDGVYAQLFHRQQDELAFTR